MNGNILLFKTERPETSLIWGYLSYVIIGVVFLSLPWFRHTNVSVLDNVFTSVSAISTTGLATVNIADSYSFLGQIVILLLIQLGGIGYMTFGSFIVLSTRHALSETREEIHKTAFSLPKDFSMKKFIRSVVIYTGIIEIIGAILLLPVFITDNRVNMIWSAIFHSVSSFCTAGFSLYNDSFELYANNIYLNVIVSLLSFLGAIGYIVMVDAWLLITKKKKSITFTSKVILGITFFLFIFGILLLFIDDLVRGDENSASFLHSVFQAMTALTTVGFNTVPIGAMSSFSLFVLIILMIIGASPSGTGGGIKSTTVSSIAGVIASVFSYKKEYIDYHVSNLTDDKDVNEKDSFFSRIVGKTLWKKQKANKRNREEDEIKSRDDELSKMLGDLFKIKLMGRTIPFNRIIHAIANFAFYFIILFIGILLLLISEPFSFEQIFFEAASALGTVGLSMGITGSLSAWGKIVIIVLMFIGRLGPITFGIFLFSRKPKYDKNEYEDIVI